MDRAVKANVGSKVRLRNESGPGGQMSLDQEANRGGGYGRMAGCKKF